MAMKDPIDRLKERLVALSVDLDDKSKLCAALSARIERERAEIARAEEVVAQEFASDLEVHESQSIGLSHGRVIVD